LGEIVDGQSRVFESYCWKERHSYQSNYRRGDGANDLPMLNLAGLVAFHAKPTVKKVLVRFPVWA
jgi:phosphoserine phosphatase